MGKSVSTATTREWDRLYAIEDAQKSGWAMIEIEGVRWAKVPAGHVIVELEALHVDALEFIELKKKHAKLEADYAMALETMVRMNTIRPERVTPADKEFDHERSRLPAASDKPPHDPSSQGRP